MRTLTPAERSWIALAIRAERLGDYDEAHQAAMHIRMGSASR
jgi:hypothetical protein